ncbi:MAG: PD40 domain-containing protein [Planctomycetes bacterium]|nr:PD40 domain-containing protein [Planctomycetota bacterium]
MIMRTIGTAIFFLLNSILVALPTWAQERLAWRAAAGVVIASPDREELVPGTADIDTFCFDRDGQSLIVTRSGRIERLVPGKKAVVLAEGYRSARFPSVCAADGRIAVAVTHASSKEARGWKILVLTPDGEESVNLGPGYDPEFSEDGSILVYESFGEVTSIRIHDFQGRKAEAVSGPEGGYTPTLSPDGSRVVFSVAGRLVQRSLFDGALEDLTPAGRYDRFATFSRDGRRLVFYRQGDERYDLIELDLATGKERIRHLGRVEIPDFAFEEQELEEAHKVLAVAGTTAPLEISDHDSRMVRGLLRLAPRREVRFRSESAPSPVLARSLAHFERSLSLSGFPDLTEPVAVELARWSGNGERYFLRLDDLVEPDPKVIAALATTRGWGLSLGGLKRLDASSITALSVFRGACVSLAGLEQFDLTTAQAMIAGGCRIKFLEVPGPLIDPKTTAWLATRETLLRACPSP